MSWTARKTSDPDCRHVYLLAFPDVQLRSATSLPPGTRCVGVQPDPNGQLGPQVELQRTDRKSREGDWIQQAALCFAPLEAWCFARAERPLNEEARAFPVWVPRHPALSAALNRLYEVFADRRWPGLSREEMSPLSPLPEPVRQELQGGLRRELTPAIVSSFAFKSMSTVGDERHFCALLPRILEVVVNGQFDYDLSVVLGKLERASWREWPAAQQNAVRAVFHQWVAGAAVGAAPPSLAERVEGLEALSDTLSDALTTLMATDAPGVDRRLLEWVESLDGDFEGPPWSDAAGIKALLQGPVQQRIEGLALGEGPWAARAATVIDGLFGWSEQRSG